MKTKKSNQDDDVENIPGYPIYPEGEDIYDQFEEEEDIDPEDITKLKTVNYNDESETKFIRIDTGGESVNDLDVPGSESDNEMEDVGSEDEENNYYSLGGDNHDDLEEDNSN